MLLTTLVLGCAPAVALSPGSLNIAAEAAVAWRSGPLEQALEHAERQQQMVMVYAWQASSEYCTRLYGETLQSPEAVQALGAWTCYSASFDDEVGAETARSLNVQTLPTLLFLDASGNVEDAIAGFIDTPGLLAEIERIQSGEGTLSDLRAKAEKATESTEDAFATRFAFAGKLADLGYQAKHDEILAAIRAADPGLKTSTGAQCHLWSVQEQIREAGGGYENVAGWDIKPLYDLAKRAKSKAGRFAVWSAVGSTEATRDQPAAAFDAFATAWKSCPDVERMSWAADIVGWVADTDELSLSKKQRRLVVAMAEEALQRFERIEPGSPEAHEYMGAERYEDHHAWYLDRLARAYHRAGKNKDAVAAAERVVLLAPEDEQYKERLTQFRRDV